eukprot:jgi/Hompol1/5767/HPOL_001400-RA
MTDALSKSVSLNSQIAAAVMRHSHTPTELDPADTVDFGVNGSVPPTPTANQPPGYHRRFSNAIQNPAAANGTVQPGSRRTSDGTHRGSIDTLINTPNPNPDTALSRRSTHTLHGTDIEHSAKFRRLSVAIADAFLKASEEEEQPNQPQGIHLSPSFDMFGSKSRRLSSGTPSRKQSLISIEQILADREAEARGYYLTGKPRRDVSTQTDESEITEFETLDGIYFSLRDELEITEEMMYISQRQYVRSAATEVFNRVSNEILKMEQEYRSSLHSVREQCRKQLNEAIEKVLLGHKAKAADIERVRITNVINSYQDQILERDQSIHMLRQQITQLDAMHDEFDRQSVERTGLPVEKITKPESPVAQQQRVSRNTASPTQPQPAVDPDTLLAQQLTESYIGQVQQLEASLAQKLEQLEKQRDRTRRSWEIKIRSAERLKDEGGTLKILRRQERLVQLAQKVNRPRPKKDVQVSAFLSGMTMATADQREAEEKEKARLRELEEQEKKQQQEIRAKMSLAHKELKETASRNTSRLNLMLLGKSSQMLKEAKVRLRCTIMAG